MSVSTLLTNFVFVTLESARGQEFWFYYFCFQTI